MTDYITRAIYSGEDDVDTDVWTPLPWPLFILSSAMNEVLLPSKSAIYRLTIHSIDSDLSDTISPTNSYGWRRMFETRCLAHQHTFHRSHAYHELRLYQVLLRQPNPQLKREITVGPAVFPPR